MIKKFKMMVTPFNEERMIHMYLPDDYETSNKKYPVMYYFDGHNLFLNEDATYGKSWGLKEFMESWDQQLIIVGVECSHHGNDRLSEYSPYPINNPYWGNLKGEGQKTMDWYVNELKPYIDANFPTLTDRKNTGIAGSSMGGLMAIYAGVHYNHIFSRLGCLSSAIGMVWDDVYQEVSSTPLDPDTKFYLNWGSEEARDKQALTYSTDRNLTISHLLTENGAKSYPHIMVGGGHNEASWEKTVPVFMNYLWK